MRKAKFYYNDTNAPKPNHIGAVAIIEKEGYVLLEQRSDSLKWAFIGGGLGISSLYERHREKRYFANI